ncbi:MAG TPA: DNA-3-methyladenine glycosylase [Microvirga sp.]|jgi:DNA-3-methyladenine glycosylase II
MGQAPTILDSDAALKAGLERLVTADAVMARLVEEGALPRLRKRPAGFEGLAWIVVGQQVSTASAAAIWGRVQEALGAVTAQRIAAASDEELKTLGLSAPKIRTLRALAEAVGSGALPLGDLAAMDAEAAHGRLTAVKGIGPWTADVYLLFCLGHPDIFPAGDLALQEAARAALRLETRPDAKALARLAERWRPWRGVAAKVLWSYYRIVKAREGAPIAP